MLIIHWQVVSMFQWHDCCKVPAQMQGRLQNRSNGGHKLPPPAIYIYSVNSLSKTHAHVKKKTKKPHTHNKCEWWISKFNWTNLDRPKHCIFCLIMIIIISLRCIFPVRETQTHKNIQRLRPAVAATPQVTKTKCCICFDAVFKLVSVVTPSSDKWTHPIADNAGRVLL